MSNSCLLACLLTCLLACLLACLLVCLLAYLFACLLACRLNFIDHLQVTMMRLLLVMNHMTMPLMKQQKVPVLRQMLMLPQMRALRQKMLLMPLPMMIVMMLIMLKMRMTLQMMVSFMCCMLYCRKLVHRIFYPWTTLPLLFLPFDFRVPFLFIYFILFLIHWI